MKPSFRTLLVLLALPLIPDAAKAGHRFIPACLQGGLIAREMVDLSSNNGFVNEICIHGQQGVNIQSNNFFELGVTVSMPDVNTQLEIPANGLERNPGLAEALHEQNLDPRRVNHIDATIMGLLELDPATVIEVDEKFDGPFAPGMVYHVNCSPNKRVGLPNNLVISDVVIVAECKVHIGSGAFLSDVVIASRAGGNGFADKAKISIAANVQLGLPDNCAELGGVTLLSNGTIHTAASTSINGVRMDAAGDIALGASTQGINGILAQSGGTITMTSKNAFGSCAGGVPGL